MKSVVVKSVLLVLVAGCAPGEWRTENGQSIEPEVTSRPQSDRFSGHLVWGHEARSFTTCDGDREGWVVNEAGDELVDVYEELTSAPYQELFVEVRGEWGGAPPEGFSADFPASLRITELIRAEGEGFGCRLDLNDVLFIANGNEPFWRLHIRENGVSMWSMDSPGETKFPAAEKAEESDVVTFITSTRDTDIRVILEKRRCVDSMSGARYQYVATLDMNDKQFVGCAIVGL